MGGYVFPPREGYPTWGPDSDFNVQIDPQSAHYIIARSNPTFVPLAVTLETSLRRAYLSTLNQAGPVARLIARQAAAFAGDEKYEARYGRTCCGLPDDTINFLHDPLACAVALGWGGVEVQEVSLKSEIADGWLRHTIHEGGKPTRVVTGVSGEKFSDFWLRTVARMDQ
jgi:inosine-uridine nucleoside N-ribohydrolase